jgi:hypothetical protein
VFGVLVVLERRLPGLVLRQRVHAELIQHARANTLDSSVLAAKLRGNTAATLVGIRNTSWKPSGNSPDQVGPTKRNFPPGVPEADPSWWHTFVITSTIWIVQ